MRSRLIEVLRTVNTFRMCEVDDEIVEYAERVRKRAARFTRLVTVGVRSANRSMGIAAGALPTDPQVLLLHEHARLRQELASIHDTIREKVRTLEFRAVGTPANACSGGWRPWSARTSSPRMCCPTGSRVASGLFFCLSFFPSPSSLFVSSQ